jgi:hypothetical protein
MKTFARKVMVTPQRKGRRQANYTDLVLLDHGAHAGEYALIDPLCPPTRPEYIRVLLSPDEALQRLKSWEHQKRPASDGSTSQIFPDGQTWLQQP